MPPKRSKTLTQAELRLMRVLWSRGESTVADMVSSTSGEAALAYTSVLTTIRILETKGYVSHRQDGRAFLYSTIATPVSKPAWLVTNGNRRLHEHGLIVKKLPAV